ncbi:MAG: DUF2029 domain-containing protein [Verrucomicrobiae bacterium]|nr:DUF2029 domain-containing protein [Verrucomicrobiae bacterium]
MIAAAALSMGKGFTNALRADRSDDFQWRPASVLVTGSNPYREFIDHAHRERITSATENNALPNYPLTGYVFLAPFGAVEWGNAKVAWAVLNLLCAGGVAISIAVLAGPPGSRERRIGLLAALAMLCSAPARDQIAAGQHTLFALCAFLGAWIAGRRERRWWLSALLIAVSWFKFTVTVPLSIAFLFRKGRWREPAAALTLHAGLFALACAWTGTPPLTYLRDYAESARLALEVSGIRSDVWDTLSLGRLILPESGLAGLGLSVGWLGAAVWLAAKRDRRSRKADDLEVLAILAVPATLAGFHLRYDFVALGLAAAWVATRSVPRDACFPLAATIALNWYGARVLERLYFEPIDAVNGIWAAPGILGLNAIALLHWLACLWLVGRLTLGEASPVPTASHHGIGKKRDRSAPARIEGPDIAPAPDAPISSSSRASSREI